MLIILTWLFSILLAQGAFAVDLPDSASIRTEQEALDRSLAYLGFERLEGFDVKKSYVGAELVTFVDTTTPFLAEELNGRVAWRVDFTEIVLEYEDVPREEELAHPRPFSAWIDAETGLLLEVRSSIVNMDNRRALLKSGPLSEEQCTYYALEKYYALPDSLPQITLARAFSVGWAENRLSKSDHMIIRCVLFAGEGAILEDPLKYDAWVITFLGVPHIAPLSAQHVVIDCRSAKVHVNRESSVANGK